MLLRLHGFGGRKSASDLGFKQVKWLVALTGEGCHVSPGRVVKGTRCREARDEWEIART